MLSFVTQVSTNGQVHVGRRPEGRSGAAPGIAPAGSSLTRTRSDRSLRNPAPGNSICTGRQSSAARTTHRKGFQEIGSAPDCRSTVARHPSLTSRWRNSSGVTKSHQAPKPTTVVTAPSSTSAKLVGKSAHLVLAASSASRTGRRGPLTMTSEMEGPARPSRGAPAPGRVRPPSPDKLRIEAGPATNFVRALPTLSIGRFCST